MEEELKLIPELKNWKKDNGESFGIEDWIACEGDIKLAIGFSTVFWPEFIEFEGCIMRANSFDEGNFNDWKKAEYIENMRQIELVINHIHLVDLFSWEKQQNINVDQIRHLGRRLKNMLEAKLKFDFPTYEFEVEFNGDIDFEDLYDYEVTFSQPKNIFINLKD